MSALCETVRESLSASLDGEPGPMDADEVEVHLAGCGECRRWQERFPVVTRQLRLRAVDPPCAAPLSVHLAVQGARPTRAPARGMATRLADRLRPTRRPG